MMLTSILRRAALAAAVLPALAIGSAQAQYPVRPARIVISFSPSGPTDILTRLIAKRLSESLGQQFIVDNRPGGAGTIGAQLAARAAPDGYTLFLGGITSLVITPHIHKKLAYDPVKDFAPITKLTSQPLMLVVRPVVPVRSLKEFIALVRAKPGDVNYATSGIGSTGHLAGELFKVITRTDMVHVPYKSAGAAITSLAVGESHVVCQAAGSVTPLIKAGKLRPIVVAGRERVPSLPAVPTSAEAGLPAFAVESWSGLVAPAATPPQIVHRLYEEIATILDMADIQAFIRAQGATPALLGPEDFGAYIAAERAEWTKVIKTAGIKAE